MLKQPTRIFQIIGKQVLNDKVIRFILDDDLNYLNSISNHINCANISPYNNYQTGNHLGISVGEIEKGGNLSFPSQEVFSDTNLVKRVKKAPNGYNGTTFDDLVFGRGWMEDDE